MARDGGVGRKVIQLLGVHPRLRLLTRKAQAAEIGVHQSVLTRWEQGTDPKRETAERAASALGVSTADLDRPIEDLERAVAAVGSSNWTRLAWTVSGRTVERWRHLWPKTYEVVEGSHLVHLRIPRRNGEDLLSTSLLVVKDLSVADGLRFSITNIDDSQRDPALEIVYRYDGLAFPVADTLHFVGGSEDGAEPLSMILDLPQHRGALSGYLVAVGRAPGKHHPMARRVIITPVSRERVSLASVRSQLGIFAWTQAPQAAQALGSPDH